MDVVTRIDTVQNEKTTPSGGRFQLRNPAATYSPRDSRPKYHRRKWA